MSIFLKIRCCAIIKTIIGRSRHLYLFLYLNQIFFTNTYANKFYKYATYYDIRDIDKTTTKQHPLNINIMLFKITYFIKI